MAVEMICTWCGGTDVARDAWAAWDVVRQEWVLGTVFDDGFCQTCGRERELETRDSTRMAASLAIVAE